MHNIILIQTDQMNAACLGMTGPGYVRVPNLKRLAREGCLFSDATAQSPICMPSRISMLSGQYCSTTRQFGFVGLCDRRTEWLPSVMKRAGYQTGAFGKFHVMSIGHSQWDFDIAAPTLPEENDLSRPAGNHYKAYCQNNGIQWPTDQMHGHNPYEEKYKLRFSSKAKTEFPMYKNTAMQSDVPLAHSLETYTTDRCIEFIKNACHDPQCPFFAWLTYDRPHYPTTLPKEWFDRIEIDTEFPSDLPSEEELVSLPEGQQSLYKNSFSKLNRFINKEDFHFVLATYYKLIEWIDSEIGRVMETLSVLGIDRSTTIVFTSDHGDEAGFRGLMNKQRRISSQAVTRVPLIIRPAPYYFTLAEGRVIEQPVELVDVFPTLCSLCGLPMPRETEGYDLSDTILGNNLPIEDRPVFCEEYTQKMVIYKKWKLIFDAQNDDNCQLYNLNEDEFSLLNIYGKKEYMGKRIELKRILYTFLMQRINGPYNEEDEHDLKSALNPDSERLGLLHNTNNLDFPVNFRAGSLIHDNQMNIGLFVPYWEDDMRYIISDYQKDGGKKAGEELCERLLDKGLRGCIRSVMPISVLL